MENIHFEDSKELYYVFDVITWPHHGRVNHNDQHNMNFVDIEYRCAYEVQGVISRRWLELPLDGPMSSQDRLYMIDFVLKVFISCSQCPRFSNPGRNHLTMNHNFYWNTYKKYTYKIYCVHTIIVEIFASHKRPQRIPEAHKGENMQ